MTPERDPAELLDEALAGSEVDPRVAHLNEIGDELRQALAPSVSPAPGTRALFVQGVSARSRTRSTARVLIPAIALGLIALVVATLSRTALPGTALYQVRKVLASVDLAPSAQHEIDSRIARARDELALAESQLPDKPAAALSGANIALEQLGQTRSFLDDAPASGRSRDLDAIALLEERADSVIAQAQAVEHPDSPSGGSSPTTSTDGSGDGPARSDDSGGGPDNTGSNDSQHGSGGGGSGSDSSGSNGSGDDNGSSNQGSSGDGGNGGSKDSSGSSGGSGSDDSGKHAGGDRSGSGSPDSGDSGSGGSGSGSDSSGSGSSGGSTSDDSRSGSGSGSDDS